MWILCPVQYYLQLDFPTQTTSLFFLVFPELLAYPGKLSTNGAKRVSVKELPSSARNISIRLSNNENCILCSDRVQLIGMTFQEIEEIFNRAWRHAFSRKKFMLGFASLLACGVLVVFCKTLSVAAGPWVVMSMSFLPVFLCSGVMLGTGVLLSRLYYHEIKGNNIQFRKLLVDSFEVFMGTAYLSLPMALGYLLLWVLMGIFFLLKSLPMVGEGIGILLSFGPFLLVLASLLLGFFSLLVLFYATPHIALKKQMQFHIAEEILDRLRASPFSNILLLIIGLSPLLACVGFLTVAALLTGLSYVTAKAVLGVSLQWFFIMIPFSLIMTPFVVFFFNFSTESFGFLSRRARKGKLVEEECASQL